MALAAAAGDLAEDDPVEGLAHPAQAGERATGPAQHLEPVLALIEGEPPLERRRDVDAGAVRVETEQRAHRDAHRHVPGPVVKVDPLDGSPSVDLPVCLSAQGHGLRRDTTQVQVRY